MTILSAQTIRNTMYKEKSGFYRIIEPFYERTKHEQSGTTFGLSMCGYDVRLDQNVTLFPGQFKLASTLEKFYIPNDIMATVHDKSTWARRGLAVQNTVIEPGWVGFLTLELTNHGLNKLELIVGTPIAQVIFQRLDYSTDGYNGKYQNQERGPQEAK